MVSFRSFIIIGLAITVGLCCRYGRRYCKRAKELEDEEFVDAEEYLQSTDLRKPSAAHRAHSVPLKPYNGDDVRL